jgi:hypothetical protein
MKTTAKTEIKTNAVEVYNKFLKLNTKEMGRALKAGVRRGLLVIRNDARKLFRVMFPAGTIRNPKYSDTLEEGIRMTKVKESKSGEVAGYVLATSSRKSGSGSYRLVFLEGGTVPRYTRKKYYRGQLRPALFFTTTVTADGPRYGQIVLQQLEKTVDKINKANLR